jgi:hypothetical protein
MVISRWRRGFDSRRRRKVSKLCGRASPFNVARSHARAASSTGEGSRDCRRGPACDGYHGRGRAGSIPAGAERRRSSVAEHRAYRRAQTRPRRAVRSRRVRRDAGAGRRVMVTAVNGVVAGSNPAGAARCRSSGVEHLCHHAKHARAVVIEGAESSCRRRGPEPRVILHTWPWDGSPTSIARCCRPSAQHVRAVLLSVSAERAGA